MEPAATTCRRPALSVGLRLWAHLLPSLPFLVRSRGFSQVSVDSFCFTLLSGETSLIWTGSWFRDLKSWRKRRLEILLPSEPARAWRPPSCSPRPSLPVSVSTVRPLRTHCHVRRHEGGLLLPGSHRPISLSVCLPPLSSSVSPHLPLLPDSPTSFAAPLFSLLYLSSTVRLSYLKPKQ